jgi:hypothetical protein
MTIEKKIEVLEKVLEHLNKDQIISKQKGLELLGLCATFRFCNSNIKLFPEVMRYKPEKKKIFWFNRNPINTQRIELVEKVLSDLKKNY